MLQAGRVPQAGTAPREGSASGLAKKKTKTNRAAAPHIPSPRNPRREGDERAFSHPQRRGARGSGGGRSRPRAESTAPSLHRTGQPRPRMYL